MEEDGDENSSEWLLTTLREVQLDQFYVRIRDHLQISRISHFEYVTPEDLEKVNPLMNLLKASSMLIFYFFNSYSLKM